MCMYRWYWRHLAVIGETRNDLPVCLKSSANIYVDQNFVEIPNLKRPVGEKALLRRSDRHNQVYFADPNHTPSMVHIRI